MILHVCNPLHLLGCNINGYELALPYVMDLCRTRDCLLGILPLEEMLPLDQAVELFKPQTVDHNVKELPPESVITQNTKIVPPESFRPFEKSSQSKPKSKKAAIKAKKAALKSQKAQKEAESILFASVENDDLFSANLKKADSTKQPSKAEEKGNDTQTNSSTNDSLFSTFTKKSKERPKAIKKDSLFDDDDVDI